MAELGAFIQQAGILLGVAGFGIYIASIVYRIGLAFRLVWFQRQAFLIGFYARAAGMVGIMGAVTGGIIVGTTPWPWLIAVFVLGAPSLALLLVRPVRDDLFEGSLPKRGNS
jgi:MFS family permease